MPENLSTLTEEERKIIELLRTVAFGKVIITVKNGTPVYAETQKTIPLQSNRL